MKSILNKTADLYGWEAPNEEIKNRLLENRHGSTSTPVMFANILVAAVIVAASWHAASHALLLGWLSAIAMVVTFLMWSMQSYARYKSEKSPEYWAFLFTLGAFVNGIAWGTGSLLLFDPTNPTANILMIGVICGMTAGNVVTSFAVPTSVYSYLAPAILLSMYMPLTRGSMAEFTLALLWIPYLVIMVMLTRTAHRGLAQSIRLGYENAQLAKNLAAAKERAEKLARAKSDFLAIMSHEIRTPMHGMLGIADLLTETQLDRKQQIYLEHLRGAGSYLAQLLNNILDFSKIEAEKLTLNNGRFSIKELVADVISLFALQTARKGVMLDTVIPEDIENYWYGDGYRLKQILINLVGNAFKFTAAGSIKIEISAEGQVGERTCVRFRVIDSGSGIPPDIIDTIFDAFSQQSSLESQAGGGTGLGLAISKRLVDAMGGDISVKSQPGQGSTFTFTALLLPAQAVEQMGSSEDAIAEDIPLSAARVLIADDSPFNRLVVREFLTNSASSIDEAENGAEALHMFQANHYDIVLMDMRMPVMNGIETVRRIRNWESSNRDKRTLIIMLTASVFENDRKEIMQAGCDDILIKPFQKDGLFKLLRKQPLGTNTTLA